MMKIEQVLVVIIIVLVLILAWTIAADGRPWETMSSANADRTTVVTCDGDLLQYHVLARYPDYKEAGCLLSRLNNKALDLLRYLKSNLITYNVEERDAVRRVLQNYNPEVMVEVSPTANETSYTIDKGRKIGMCIRDYDGTFIDESMLMFVLLHEMSHAANKGWAHSWSDFWPIFKFMLVQAKAAGVHNPVDYAHHPSQYVFMKVSWSPYYDPTLPEW